MEIRGRLSAPQPRRLPPCDARQAAVLVPLYVDSGELWTLLTKRTDVLPHHRGQIAFPGGSLDPGEDAWAGALREAEEEVGIVPRSVLRLGELDEVRAQVSSFRIVPCVAAVPYPVETTLNEDEIEEIFPVSLTAFLDSEVMEDREVVVDGRERSLRVYHIGGREVWGLTARIIQLLLIRLGFEESEA